MIPEDKRQQNEIIDLVIESVHTPVPVENEDGTISTEGKIDYDSLWSKTLLVDSNTFGMLIFVLKEIERTVETAYYNMNYERAHQYEKVIMSFGKSIRRAIDAKSSESQHDKNNSRSTLLDKVGRNRIEKVYTDKSKVQNGLMDMFVRRDKARDMEDD